VSDARSVKHWFSLAFYRKRNYVMKEFVEYIVKNLVDHPDKVRINEVGGTHTLIIELGVEKSDIGKIIGKKGKTINAIRTLLMSVASRNGIRVNLEIIEEAKTPA
jgi:predicted RNA-binding protein YlqC (UPF0109 family)